MFPRDWRNEALSRLGEIFDLVIIGGGITGAGVLMDAAQRGLRVLLLDKEDIASGTSSRSSKLIHGGLRYLKQMQFSITRLACLERDRMLVLNPGLVRVALGNESVEVSEVTEQNITNAMVKLSRSIGVGL